MGTDVIGRRSYEETIAFGARQYADVINGLSRSGVRAAFTQTGGMCAALEAQLEAGYRLLITDAEDTLSWHRNEQRGWAVGLYPPGDCSDGAIAFTQDKSNDVEVLVSLVQAVLGGEANITCDNGRNRM